MAQGPRSYPGPSPEQDKGSFSVPSCCPRRGCGCDPHLRDSEKLLWVRDVWWLEVALDNFLAQTAIA